MRPRSGSARNLRSAEERAEPDGGSREGVGAPFLAVDDADRGRDPQTRLAQRLDRLERRPAGR